jgi:radical SAM protein with 4Fe4S-binding SPASM domain
MYDLPAIAADGAALARCVDQAQPYAPLYVKFKLTWRCNLRCEMCRVWEQDTSNEFTTAELVTLADELAALGCCKVHLTGGEVLLRPDLPDLISVFSARGMRVNLTTNGTLLTGERAQCLVESGLHSASVSLDSPRRKVHDRVRGRGNWKRTLNGLRALRRAREKSKAKLRIRVNTLISRTNYDSLSNLATFVQEHGVDRLTLIPVDDPLTRRLLLNKRRLRDYNARIGPQIAQDGMAAGLIDRPDQAFPFGTDKEALHYGRCGFYARGLYERQRCYAPWTHAMITPEGQVYACCMTRGAPQPLGDLRQASFRQIWEGPAYRALRQAMRDGKVYGVCHRCDDFLDENRSLHRVWRAHTEQRQKG